MTVEDAGVQEITAAYYDDKITIDQLTELVSAEAAANLWVLKRQLDEDFINEVADA